MAIKLLDLHPEALEEWKSAVAWYLERNETAASNFVVEVDRAIELVIASPGRAGQEVSAEPENSSCSDFRSRLFTESKMHPFRSSR